jgi:DNA-binding NarL/FixJ family response regulator
MSYKVLIVDDSKLARMAASKALGTLYPEWKRIEAANAEEALRALDESRPDIVLLDYNMPGQNGLDLASELLRSHPRLPVAVISANRQQEIVSRTSAIGAFFVAKPLTQEGLAEFLKVAVDQLRAPRS